MRINPQASLIAHKEILILAPSEVVWKTHTDINAWSQWQPGITTAKLAGPLAVGSIFQFKSGGLAITATTQVVEPNQQIGWTGRALGARARHVWLLTPHQNGTLLTTDESLEGWLVSLLKFIMPKFLESYPRPYRFLKPVRSSRGKKPACFLGDRWTLGCRVSRAKWKITAIISSIEDN